jgi:hypothetical protein
MSVSRTSPRWFSDSDIAHVVVDGDSGETGAKDVSPVGVGFAEEGVVPSGASESFVEAADTGEEASDIQSPHDHSPDRPARIIQPPANSAATGSNGLNPANGVDRHVEPRNWSSPWWPPGDTANGLLVDSQ